MTLRSKLLLAQAPLLAALLVVAAIAVATFSSLGAHPGLVFQDNYRSVLAAQRMADALERIDSGALFALSGQAARGKEQATLHRRRFEEELAVQEGNITEAGEAETTGRLRAAWDAYLRSYDRFAAAAGDGGADEAALRRRYFEELEPAFLAVKAGRDEILALNQDAIVRKNEAVRRRAGTMSSALLLVAVAAVALGAGASLALTSRLLRPLSVLEQATQRIARGDLEVQADVRGSDEIARLAGEFNRMAARLREYRQSSLGDLLQAQQASQAAIDSIPDPVVVFSLGGGVLSVNAAAASLGVRLEGTSDPVASAEPAVRGVLERVRGHVLGGKGAYVPKGYEEAVRIPGADGDRFLLPRGSPTYGEGGGVTGATVILQDVTRLRRFDELKSDLVATVAHELRTPLTSLRMAIHLCTEGAAGPLGEKQADLLFAARQDCERLQGIVDDVLDLARLQEGRLELERRPVPAARLLAEAAEASREAAAGKQLQLEVDPDATDAPVLVDPERLSLVFSNLLGNALRHTPPGGNVRLSARREAGRVRFEVRDTGPGIAREHHHRIFEKFYRVPGSPGGGAGLGLSIAQDVVRAHVGEIGVESEPGAGATFWFTVPVDQPSS